MAAYYYVLLFLGRKCLHVTSQKRALSHAISLAMNYCLFSHGDVSYRFNGGNDNVVLVYEIKYANVFFVFAVVVINLCNNSDQTSFCHSLKFARSIGKC